MTWIKTVSMWDDERVKKAMEAQRKLYPAEYATPVHPFSGDQLSRVGYKNGSCPNAEWTSRRIVSLPTNTRVTRRHLQAALALLNEPTSRLASDSGAELPGGRC